MLSPLHQEQNKGVHSAYFYQCTGGFGQGNKMRKRNKRYPDCKGINETLSICK